MPATARVPVNLRLRNLAVRPSGVTVQPPILASVSDDVFGEHASRAGEE
jgi:hypothetical protein